MLSVSSNVGSVVGDRLFKTSFCSQAVETLLEHLELDKRSYRLGLSQVRQNAKTRLYFEEGDSSTTRCILRKMLAQ